MRFLLAIVLCGCAMTFAQDAPQLYSRAWTEGVRLDLDGQQLRWLWEHRQLRLGVINRENPPFDILGTGLTYEGITADYAGTLARQLRLHLDITLFVTFEEAAAALRDGRIDLLGSVTSRQAIEAGLRLSRPYASDEPWLLEQADDAFVSFEPQRPFRLAVLEGYRSPEQIRTYYPNAQVQLYPAPASALAALMLDQADVFLGNAQGIRYVLGRNQSGEWREVGRAGMPGQDVGFAMSDSHSPLAELVDMALDSLTEEQHAGVHTRWRSSVTENDLTSPLQLTDAEERWLHDNPRITVLLDEHLLPLSYRDANGEWRGLSLDILQMISRRTGLLFDVRRGGTIEQMIDKLRSGQAQLIGGLPDSPSRRRQLDFSRAYLSAPRVLVTRDEAWAPSDLAQLEGQQVAVVAGSVSQETLRQQYPRIRTHLTAGPLEALRAVARGQAMGAILTYDDARSMIARWYPGSLRISASLPLSPVHFAFASVRGAKELQGILNKGLLTLAPQEIDNLVRRWRNPMIVADGMWSRYKTRILLGFSAVLVLLAMTLLWVGYLRRLHLKLRRATSKAEQANQAKTDFLATMSHEIRTPLHAVQGMLELAQRKAAQGVLDRLAIDVASDAAHGLLELIGDILDITRIEAGRLQLVPERVGLHEQAARVVQLFEQQANAKGVALHLEVQGDIPAWVMLDPLRFKQVLANLVSNAIKFTQQGYVRVSLRGRRQAQCLQVELSVEDTGIGIAASELHALGQLFRQASNQRQSARSSAGLGLGISRSLCEMMGGSLLINSVLGKGTQVNVFLNLALADTEARVEPQPVSPEPVRQAPLRVLVADDYPSNRLLLAQQLDYLGHQARVAEDGAQALRLWLKEDFDMVISDCCMPRLNGYALSRAIREHERRTGRPPCRVIGLTANAVERERRRCRAAGMDECLFKPLGLNSLTRALANCQRRAPDQQAPMFDLSHLECLVGRDNAAFKALLRDLRSSNRDDLQCLEGLNDDVPALAELAHRVKGGARIARADVLVVACEQVERCCHAQPLERAALGLAVRAMGDAMRRLERQLAHQTGQGVAGSYHAEQQQHQQNHQHHADDAGRAIAPAARVREDR